LVGEHREVAFNSKKPLVPVDRDNRSGDVAQGILPICIRPNRE